MSLTVNVLNVSHSPWKNGGGFTQELLTWPKGEPWQFRLSLASIEASGPFSSFKGVQRVFTIVEGQLALTFDEVAYTLNHKDEPLSFDGATPCHAHLISPKVKALNVMTRSPCATKVVRLQTGQHLPCKDSQYLALFAFDNSTIDIGQPHVCLNLISNSLTWLKNTSIHELKIQSGKIIVCKVFTT